jgi:DNA-binding SARP family transcriptional activator
MRRPSPTHQFSINVFGAVDLHGAEQGDDLLSQPKRFAVFLYLLLARPRGFHRRDKIVGLFWPELPEAQARGSLRKALHAARKSLGEDILIARGDDEISVNRAKIWCDAIAFDDAHREGHYAEMLELFTGELLAGFFPDAPGFERWLEEERELMRESAGQAAWSLAERYESGAQITSAAKWARTAARFARGDERRIRKVMQLLDRAGDRAGAIEVYESFAKQLKQDFEVEPSPETQTVAREIRGRT